MEIVTHKEIAQKESGGTTLLHAGEKLYSLFYIGTFRFWLEIEHLTNDIQNVLTTFLGRDVLLNLIGEEDHTYLIVVLDSTEGEGGRNLCHHIALELLLGTEIQRTTDIDEQHHRQLTLLLEHLHIRAMEAGCHIPVDIADIITELILTHLAEGHTPTLEG